MAKELNNSVVTARDIESDDYIVAVRIVAGQASVFALDSVETFLAEHQTITLILFTQDDNESDPTATWGDDGYGTQTLGSWHEDTDDIPATDTGTRRMAISQAKKTDDTWSQISWVVMDAE